MESPKQEIRFTLTQNDFWYLLLYAYARKRRSRYVVWTLFVLVVAAVTVITKAPATLILGLVVAAAVLGVVFLSMWLAARKSSRALQNRGTHVITLSKEGIVHENEQTRSTTRWRAVRSVGADAHNVYLQLDNPGRIFMAIVIPRRAFQDTSAADAFLSEARGYCTGR